MRENIPASKSIVRKWGYLYRLIPDYEFSELPRFVPKEGVGRVSGRNWGFPSMFRLDFTATDAVKGAIRDWGAPKM
jgi:hypothetical protein